MRVKYVTLIGGLLLLFHAVLAKTVSERVFVKDLKCEGVVNPKAVNSCSPDFSWKIISSQRNTLQQAYRILVASSVDKLEAGDGDLWDSGIVKSGQSTGISYKGKMQESRANCFWKVKVWTNKGETGWSDNASWSTGLLYYNDWKGRWIGFDRLLGKDSNSFHSRLSARYLRKEFKLSGQVKQARVYIIGLGLYELYINGKKVGTQVLAPSPTDYLKNVKYNVFDVTQNLTRGDNAMGVILGNGRYYTMRQHYKNYKIKNFGFPKLLLQLEIDYTDGSHERIVTNNSWKGTGDGPILSNNEYDGEEYDARKEFFGWDSPGFDDSAWMKAEYVEEAPGRFEAQMNPGMKVMESIRPLSLTPAKNGKYILDMGQNMVGWVKMKVQGKSGDRVKLRFAEILDADGGLFTDNLRDARATDIYTLKGGSEEFWEPRFVYHGFRYVEISGYPGVPELDDFSGQVVYDDMQTTGTFETSDSIINRVFKSAYWGIRGNYKGMPVDCPQRNERQPWLGDRAMGCYGESFLFDNHQLYKKWMEDIAYSQKWDGCIGDVAPNFWRYYSDNVTWPATFLMVADMLYVQFGDKQPVLEHYQAMKKWLEYMKKRYMTNDFIITRDAYGDWCKPPETIEAGRGKNANRKYPSKLIATAYYYYLMQLMQKFADITGNPNDKIEFKQLAQNIRLGFNKKFYKGNGVYGNNELTDNILALATGVVADSESSKVADNIVDIVANKNNGHLSTGLIGTQWIMRTLSRLGRPDLALQLATTTSYPGWGYMVEHGATTIWELWNGNTAAPQMNSYNHVMMLGDLLIWYYENLAGIKSDEENKPGFKLIQMKPEFPNRLNHVKASYLSGYGLILSEWKKQEGMMTWKVRIPANTKARLWIPAESLTDITEGTQSCSAISEIKFIAKEGERIVLEIGSGEYRFKTKKLEKNKNNEAKK